MDDSKRSVQKKSRSSIEAKIAELATDHQKMKKALPNAIMRKKRSPAARAIAKGDSRAIKKGLFDVVAHLPLRYQKKIHDIVCVEYSFCDTRSDTKFVIGSVLAMIGAGVSLPLPVLVAIAGYRSLNIHCNCPKSPLDDFTKTLFNKMMAKFANIKE